MNPEAKQWLGKQVDYPLHYCKDILVAIPRATNRKIYHIREEDNLFIGFDCWHAYEIGFLLHSGLPVCGLLKIVYPSDSPSIVESKSFKLYLGSFNMTPMGANKETAIKNFTDTVGNDLSNLLSCHVKVCFFQDSPAVLPTDFEDYTILENEPGISDLSCSVYKEYPGYLQENTIDTPGELKIGSLLLRSNCKVTNQPDWGSIYIHLKSQRLPANESVLKYIVSLRAENHFHEEICEMVFKRLSDLFQPEILTVSCLYTRRGGIDICPVRSNKAEFLPPYIIHENILTQQTFRQ